jgi:hypothetical protein
MTIKFVREGDYNYRVENISGNDEIAQAGR